MASTSRGSMFGGGNWQRMEVGQIILLLPGARGSDDSWTSSSGTTRLAARVGRAWDGRLGNSRSVSGDAIADAVMIAIAGAANGALRGQIRAPGAPHFSKRAGYREPIRRATT